MYFLKGRTTSLLLFFRMSLCPSLSIVEMLLYRKCSHLRELSAESTAAVTLLRYAHVRLLNLPDSMTNARQSSKPQPPNALWQGRTQSYNGMFHPIYPRPGLTSPNPYASADLSWADVTEGIELEKEVVVGKWHLWVGNAAVVAYRDHRGINGNKSRAARVISEHWSHLQELWSRKSPEPSQFRKSPVSTQRSRHSLTHEFRKRKTSTDTISLKQIYPVEAKII